MTLYQRPSYSDLLIRIAADLAAMPEVLRQPLSAMWARATHGEHGHLEWIYKQCSPLNCELERLYDWAALYAVPRLMATASSGTALAVGNVGTPLLANTTLRGQNGLDYTVVAAVKIGANATPVTIKCATTGLATNLIAGQTLTLVDPVPGISNTLTVAAGGISGGANDELVESWRERVAEEWRTITTSGARSGKPEDYRFWAKSAHPSVTTALVQPHALGMGSVVIRPICNGLANRLPTQAVIDAVVTYLLAKAPATADTRTVSPLVRTVAPSIHLLPGFDTAANRAAITNALTAMVLAETSETAVLAMGEIDGAIGTVTSQYTRIAPTADIVVNPGEVLVLQPVVWS